MPDRWMYERGIRIDFSLPGTPTDNATVESFNGRFRQECLNGNGFMSLEDARCKIGAWRILYNQSHPHSAPGRRRPPNLPKICRLPEYAARMKPGIPDYGWITYGERDTLCVCPVFEVM